MLKLREQREHPQDKVPHSDTGTPTTITQIEIVPVEGVLAELDRLKKKAEQKRCGCW